VSLGIAYSMGTWLIIDGIEWIELALGSFMAGCYEYEMNSCIQQYLEVNHRKALCLPKK